MSTRRGSGVQATRGRRGSIVYRPTARPILVTGIARSGTSWVGRMLCAGGAAGYVEEPFNLVKVPGTLRLPARHWYEYVCGDNEERFFPWLDGLLRFRYPLVRELARCRTPTDLRRTAGTWRSFHYSRGRRPLLVVLPARTPKIPRLVRVLETRPLVWAGVISYSVFLWHEPLVRWLQGNGLTIAGVPGLVANTALALALTMALATLSYRWVERPAIRRKAHRAARGTPAGVPTDEAQAAP